MFLILFCISLNNIVFNYCGKFSFSFLLHKLYFVGKCYLKNIVREYFFRSTFYLINIYNARFFDEKYIISIETSSIPFFSFRSKLKNKN